MAKVICFLLFCALAVAEARTDGSVANFTKNNSINNNNNFDIINNVDRRNTKRLKKKGDPLFHVAFVYSGPINDLGWTTQHNLGRTSLERVISKKQIKILTTAFPGVSEDPSVSYTFMNNLCQTGKYDMLIAISYPHEKPMLDLADRYSSIFFLHIGGSRSGPPNYSVAEMKSYQARYLTGLLSGLMGDQINRVGVILTKPMPAVYAEANAIYKGLLDAQPDVDGDSVNQPSLIASWTNTFLEPELERYQAQVLIDDHSVDILHQQTDSPEPQLVAKEKGKTSIGLNGDMQTQVGVSVLVSVLYSWESVYSYFVQKARRGDWKEFEDFSAPLGEGLELSTFSPFVSDKVQKILNQKSEKIMKGKFEVFCGEWIEPWWSGKGSPGAGDCVTEEEIDSLHPRIKDLGFFEIPTTEVFLGEGMVITMQVLSSISLFVVFVCFVLVVCWRDTYSFRFSSVPAVIVCLLGCSLLFTTVFLLSETPTDWFCSSAVWVASLGFTLFFAPILAKTYRVFIAMKGAKTCRVVFVSNFDLSLMVLGCLVVDVILLLCFQFIDSPHAERDFDQPDLDKFEYWTVCSYDDAAAVVMYIIVIWKLLLLGVGCVLTFLVRSVNPLMNEARFLAIGIYALCFAGAILVPLVIVVDSVEAVYLVTCLGILCATNVAYLVLLVPKFFVISSGQDGSFYEGPNSHSVQIGSRSKSKEPGNIDSFCSDVFSQ